MLLVYSVYALEIELKVNCGNKALLAVLLLGLNRFEFKFSDLKGNL